MSEKTGKRKGIAMNEGQEKRLKDYPLKEWMDAADGCDYCGEKARVKVLEVDKTGNYGSIQIQHRHKPGCMEIVDSIPPDIRGFRDYVDVVGWEFSDRPITLVGREWPALKSRANIGPCLNCWKLIVGVPIILFPNEEVELDFCHECVKELGILG